MELRKFLFVFGERIFRTLVTIVLSGQVAQYYGPETFGEISIYLGILGLLYPVSVYGNEQIVSANLQGEARLNYYIKRSTSIATYNSIIIGFILIIFSWVLRDVKLFILVFPLFFQTGRLIEPVIQSSANSVLRLKYLFLTFTVFVFLRLFVLNFKLSPNWFLGFYSFEIFVGSILATASLRMGWFSRAFTLSRLVLFWKKNVALVLSSFMYVFSQTVPLFILKFASDSDALIGHFSVAFRLSMFPLAFIGLFLNTTSGYFLNDVDAKKLLKHSMFAVFIGVAVCEIYVQLVNAILPILYGIKYKESAVFLRPLIFQLIGYYLFAVYARYFLRSGAKKMILLMNFINLLILVIFGIGLTMYAGIIGLFLAQYLSIILTVFYVFRKLRDF